MSWASILTIGLRLLISLFEYMHSRQLIKAGEDKVIAAGALALLERTESGKALREHVRSLQVEDEEDLWQEMLKWKV